MASIGGITVTTMTGAPLAPQSRGKALADRAGQDYLEFRDEGKRQRETSITTMTLLTGADNSVLLALLDLERSNHRAAVLTVVTITDAHGITHPNCLILDAQIGPGRRVMYAGEAAMLLETTWTVAQDNPSA